ncbi:MAG: DUF4035 domain-containing protein [Sphingomonadaceae bacterium]
MTVAELLSRISSRELTEWIEYAKLEPFGEERADLRAAIVAATIANVYRRKGSKPFKPSDFMPAFGPEEAQSVEQQLGIVEMLNAAFGGRDLRKRRPGT